MIKKLVLRNERMIFVRKLMFWSLMICLSLSVFMFSGCGGSADTDSSDNLDTSIPNNNPETYNTAGMLEGIWEVIDQEIVINVKSGDSALEMYLVTASMTFTDTKITETSGSSTVTLHESWRTMLEGDPRQYLGIISVDIDNQVMSMMKSGADNWRCELSDEFNTVLNIEILEENIIQVTEHRLAVINDNSGIEYDNILTFRKK